MSSPGRRKRRHLIRATSDGVPDSAIYERDGWMCQMPACQAPKSLGDARRAIDPGLAGTNSPWEPSVDHIVAVALGGHDVAENKRAAHRCCNIAGRPRSLGAYGPVAEALAKARGWSEREGIAP